jgi:uncharacterized protein (DUF983 family)
MGNNEPHRGYLTTVINCLCPRCREGKLFRNDTTLKVKRNMEMNSHCPVCGQRTDIEVGFYYGTGFVSYFFCILFSALTCVLWYLTIGFSFSDSRFLIWLILNSAVLLILQPWLMRFSRALWLSWFVNYDPDWKDHKPDDTERIIEGEMNNW